MTNVGERRRGGMDSGYGCRARLESGRGCGTGRGERERSVVTRSGLLQLS